MEDIRQYVLSVVAVGIICSIVLRITNQKMAHGALIKMLSGLFLAITVISPIVKFQINGLSHLIDDLQTDGTAIAANGEAMAYDSLCAIIKEQTESYILEKASGLNLEVEVNVTLRYDKPPVPQKVTIIGKASPYAKAQLQNYIANEIGISEDNQTWK